MSELASNSGEVLGLTAGLSESIKEPLGTSFLPEAFPIYDTAILERISGLHVDALFKIIGDNPDIPTQAGWASKVGSATDIIPILQNRSDAQMSGKYAVVHEGSVVGALWASEGSRMHEYGIGYCLDKDARGKGLARCAVVSMIEQLAAIKAEEVYLQIDPTNAPSLAIPDKLGFILGETVMGIDFPVEQQRWRKVLV